VDTAIYHQNEVRKVEPGQEAEVAFKMYPGRIIKCTVDSVLWATAQGQLPIGTMNARRRGAVPANCLAVRPLPDAKDKDTSPRGHTAPARCSRTAVTVIRNPSQSGASQRS
jgi:hypothetical protein